MSEFWKYFHDSLRWPLIFRVGPLAALLRGFAVHMDGITSDSKWLRDQWLVPKAERELLPLYGESRGIMRFRFDTDESYRNRVYNAFVWHMLGGKVRGVERIYAENGLRAEISSSPNPDLWAHFRVRIDITDILFGPEALELCFWLANEFKPARSVLEGIWTYGVTNMTRKIAVGARSYTESRSRLWFTPPAIPKTPAARAPGSRSHTQTRLALHFSTPKIPAASVLRAAGVAAFTSSRVGFRAA